MKTTTIFRTIAAVALFTMSFSGVFAQSNANYVTAASDSVVVGARMPYYVAPDNDIATLVTGGFMNASVYKWTLPTSHTALKYDGTATAAPTLAGYLNENEISVVWGTAGSFQLSVVERSMPLSGSGCEQLTAEVKDVVVVAKPTFVLPSAKVPGACGTTTINVPITLSGTGPWKISYTVTKGASTINVTDQVVGIVKPYLTGVTTYTLPVDLSAAPFSGTTGVYDVQITKITDRLTAKSLNGVVGTLPGTASCQVAIIPTPTTAPIQHIKNL